MKKIPKRVIPVSIITIVIFTFLFHKIPISNVYNSIKNTNHVILSLALCVSVISNFFLSSYRWKLILQQLNCPITWKESLLIKIGSDSIIGVFPLRIGEASRILYLKRMKRIPYAKSFLSIIAEYSLNLLLLLFFIFTGIILYWFSSKGFILTKSLIFGFALILPLSLDKKLNLLSNKWRIFFNEYLKPNLNELRFILARKEIIFWTFLISGSSLVNAYLISKAVGVPVPAYKILICIPLVILIAGIPVSFLGLGLRESAFLFFFLKYASAEKLLSLGILYSFIEHLIPMILGLALASLFINNILFGRQ